MTSSGSRLVQSLAVTDELYELFSDVSVLGAMLRFEIALARAQARIGLIPGSAAEAIASAAVVEHFDASQIARDARESASIAIPFVKSLTALVEAKDKQSAGFVHLGATSQDVIDTALILLLGRAREIFARDHDRLASGLRELSDRHASTVMLSRSLLQPAPPITFGYKVAGWYGAVDRAWSRLSASFDNALVVQFGGATGTLAAYGEVGPRLTAEVARELGLRVADAPWHAHRDRLAAILCDCGIYTGALGKIARDVSLLMQDEIGEVRERGGGSSAMPNKRNPSASVLVLAAANRVPGLVASYLGCMVQEHERAAGGWQAEWPIVTAAIQTAGSAASVVAEMTGDLEIDVQRMRSNIQATHGAVFAEKAAMLLAGTLGRTAAQSVVARAAKNQRLREGLKQDALASSLLTPEQLEKIDCPENYLGSSELFRRRLLGMETDDASS